MMITTHEQLTIHCKLNWNSLEAFVNLKKSIYQNLRCVGVAQ